MMSMSWSSKPLTPRVHRGAPRSVLKLVAMALVVVAAGCSESSPALTADQLIDQARTQLLDDGVDGAVADCVIRLAERDLRIGPLDDVTRDELILNCERAVAVINGEAAESDDSARSLAFVDGPDRRGDDPELDRLWTACEDGLGQACDQLFEQSPVGSEYERFGVSCGHRDEMLDCLELDEPEGE